MRYSYLVLLVCWLSACESNYGISIPYETKPVLNVLMNKDSALVVWVTLSGRGDYPGSYPKPDNVVVELFEDGQFKEKLVQNLTPGYNSFRSSTKVQLGRTYRVAATVPGFGTVEGTDVIPDTVAIGELKHVEIPGADPFFADRKVMVQLKDKAGEKNYYRIRIMSASYTPRGDGTFMLYISNWPYMYKLEKLDLNPFGSKERDDFFIDDALFDGKNPYFTFSILYPFAMQPNELYGIEISNLTYDTYRYLQTSHEAEVKRGDPLVEKILVHNNIKNGLGIVGGGAIRYYVIPK